MGFLDNVSGVMIAVQVVAALIITIILYIITLVVLNIDSIVVNNSVKVKPKQHTRIINGYAPGSYLAKKSYNTINPLTDNFKKIGKSINTQGGAQFTYQFWIKIEDHNDDLFKDLIILLKGENRKYKMVQYHEKTTEDNPNNYTRVNTFDPEYLINCPLIKFGKNTRELQVYFNTSKGPVQILDGKALAPNVTISMNPSDDLSSRRNIMSLMPLNWTLFTFVFEENFSTAIGAENGIRFTFYFNDVPYQINKASENPFFNQNMLKQNDGNLHIFPNLENGGDFVKIANISYFNYALHDNDVKNIYKMGPPNYSAVEKDQSNRKPAYLSSYNKIDIYNH